MTSWQDRNYRIALVETLNLNPYQLYLHPVSCFSSSSKAPGRCTICKQHLQPLHFEATSDLPFLPPAIASNAWGHNSVLTSTDSPDVPPSVTPTHSPVPHRDSPSASKVPILRRGCESKTAVAHLVAAEASDAPWNTSTGGVCLFGFGGYTTVCLTIHPLPSNWSC